MNNLEFTELIRDCAAKQSLKLMELSDCLLELQQTYPESTPEFRLIGDARSKIKLAAYCLHKRAGFNGK